MAGYQEGWGKEMDAKEHISTYDSFIAASKWGTAAVKPFFGDRKFHVTSPVLRAPARNAGTK